VAIRVVHERIEDVHHLQLFLPLQLDGRFALVLDPCPLGHGVLDPDLDTAPLPAKHPQGRGRDAVESQKEAQLVGGGLEDVVVAEVQLIQAAAEGRRRPLLLDVAEDGVGEDAVLLEQQLPGKRDAPGDLLFRLDVSGLQELEELFLGHEGKGFAVGIRPPHGGGGSRGSRLLVRDRRGRGGGLLGRQDPTEGHAPRDPHCPRMSASEHGALREWACPSIRSSEPVRLQNTLSPMGAAAPTRPARHTGPGPDPVFQLPTPEGNRRVAGGVRLGS
jgi:hypothetical protein